MAKMTPMPLCGIDINDRQAMYQLARRALGIADLQDRNAALVLACQFALAHVQELREAWRTGALSENDGQGGTRSNRNVEVEVALRKALGD